MQRCADVAISLGENESSQRVYIWRLVTVFCAGWAVIYADRTVLYPLLTVIAGEFGLSGVQTGLITGAYFTLYVTGQLTSGLLAERFGLKRMLILYCLVAALGVAGFGMAAVSYFALLAVAAIVAGPWMLISGLRGRWFLGCPNEMVVACLGVGIVMITIVDWVFRNFILV